MGYWWHAAPSRSCTLLLVLKWIWSLVVTNRVQICSRRSSSWQNDHITTEATWNRYDNDTGRSMIGSTLILAATNVKTYQQIPNVTSTYYRCPHWKRPPTLTYKATLCKATRSSQVKGFISGNRKWSSFTRVLDTCTELSKAQSCHWLSKTWFSPTPLPRQVWNLRNAIVLDKVVNSSRG